MSFEHLIAGFTEGLSGELNLLAISLLFITMFLLALMPSLSVFTVTSRTISYGRSHGAATAVGIVFGDLIYILIAVYGLIFIQGWLDKAGYMISFIAGMYLLYLARSLWLSRDQNASLQNDNQNINNETPAILSSFSAGFLLTLADQKVIFFYLGFFPLFLNLETVNTAQTFLLLLITTLTVGSAKLFYVFATEKLIRNFKNRGIRIVSTLAATMLLLIGILLLWRAGDQIYTLFLS